MKYLRKSIVMQEVPEHVSLCFEITECPYACDGCHSPELQEDVGMSLTPSIFISHIKRYEKLFDCVLFFGGDHEPHSLIELLNIAKSFELKTCLWTGSDIVRPDILCLLDFLKTGRYIKELGPLGSPTTNQKYINLKTGESIHV